MTPKKRRLRVAKCDREGASGRGGEIGVRILRIQGLEATDLGEVTIGGAVRGDKQGDSSDLLPHLCCLGRGKLQRSL